MKKKDRKELRRYVRWVANEMGLRDWTIVIDEQPQESNACVEAVDGRKLARIWFCMGFRGMEPENQRRTIVHELVHLHMSALQHQVENDLEEILGQQADMAFCRSFRRNLEHGVDALAEALAKHMPLIDWPN